MSRITRSPGQSLAPPERHTLPPHWLLVPLLLATLGSLLLPEDADAARRKKADDYEPASLAPYVGYWEGGGAIDLGRQRGRGEVAFSITQEVVLFEITYGWSAGIRGELEPLGLRDGALHLAVARVETKDRPIEIGQIVLQLKPNSGGVMELKVESPEPEPEPTSRRGRRSRRSSPPPPPPPSNQRTLRFLNATLGQAHTLTGPKRPYGGSSYLRYADWRTDASGFGDMEVRREEADQRVAQDIQRLQSSGWKCLTQVHYNIPGHGSLDLTLDSPPGTPRIHLLYSRLPGPRIVYSASKEPSGYLRYLNASEERNYPLIVSENGWTTKISLTTQPAPGSLERLDYPIPVTVFIFGNTPGDYGTGCQLEEFGLENTRQFDEYLEVLGGIALAVGLEAVRRESVESDAALLQALATIGRNEVVEATLRRLFPRASAEEIGYFGRWATLLLSRDVSALSLFRDTAREAVVQQIRREHPEFAGDAKMIDLLVDLHLQRQALRRGEGR